MTQPKPESAVNPLPPVVVALFLVIVVVEGAFSLGARGLVGGAGAVGWRLEAMRDYAFLNDVFDWMMTTGRFPAEHVLRFVTYPFLHGTFTHALFGGVMLLALGKLVGEAIGELRLLVLFVASSVAGAVAYGALLDDPTPLIGAFPPIYGLIGGFTYLLWLRLGQLGAQQLRAFSLIGVLLALQLIFALFFGGSNQWIADLAGFATGFGLSVVLVPGGWARLVAWLRRG